MPSSCPGVQEPSSASVSILPRTLCTLTSSGQIEPYEVVSARTIKSVERRGRQKFLALVLVIPK